MPTTRHSLLVILLFACLCYKIDLLAQEKLILEKLTINDGLSQGFVTSLMQDSDGFIWIGTKNGLNRYDGKNFKTYTYNPFDSTTISSNWIVATQEYGDRLLFGSIREGLNIFDKKTGRFQTIWSKEDSNYLLNNCEVRQIEVDKFGNIWIKIQAKNIGWSLLKILMPKGWQTSEWKNKIEVQFKLYKQVTIGANLHFALNKKKDKIWFNGQDSLYKLDIATDNITSYSAPKIEGGIYCTNASTNSKDIIWFNDENSITQFDEKSWHQAHLESKIRKIEFSANKQNVFIQGHDKFLVAATDKFSGTKLSDADAAIVIPFKKEMPTAFIQDKSGILWLGTNGYGILKYNPRIQHFNHSLRTGSINTPILVIDRNNYVINKNGSYLNGQRFEFLNSLIDNGHNIQQLITEGDEVTWAITQKPDIDSVYVYKKVDSIQWKKITQFEFPYHTNPLQSILDNNNCLLVYSQGILKRFYPQNKIIETFNITDLSNGSLIGYGLKQTKNGKLWIGTREGLVEATPKGNGYDFKIHQIDTKNPNSLQNNYVTSLLPDPKFPEILWIGTNGGGLNKLNISTGIFTKYDVGNGFPDDVIYGVLSGVDGSLWMSSNKGIIHFRPELETFKIYTIENGLPTNEFNRRAYAKAPDDTMFFGCVEGLIKFHPSNLETNDETPLVRIINLAINNSTINPKDSTGILFHVPEYTENIELDYSQNNISLELTALEFSIPSKNKFKYYLEGVESEWSHETTDPKVTYLNLNPGKYIFKAKASNSDGVWSKEITSLKIKVLPPWYRTTAAYIIYLILILSGIYCAFLFLLYRQRLKHELALEQKEAERLKELDEFKSNLYTNITHEFRTPLTVIKGMADQIDENPEKWMGKGLNMIRRNTDNLLNLVNQILELRKLRSNTVSVNIVNGDVVAYVKYIIESFQSYLQGYDLQFSFQSGLEACQMDYDPDKLMGVISNLLSNAVKYTPAGGHIYFRIKKEIADSINQPQSLLLEIQDTGQGIPADELSLIFDRFYQSSLTTSRSDSSGIGLSLVKELVKLMGGEISVASTVYVGTTFSVKLPIGNSVASTKAVLPILQPIPIVASIPETTTSDQTTIKKLSSSSSLPTLLIIEDNMDVAQYLIACIENDYQVSHAINGEKGIEVAIETVPDIIISDVMMPIKDGYEVVNTLKNDERTSHIPIILLTAKSDDASRIKGLQRGADAYLSKPFNKEELLVRLEKLLDLRKKLQQRYASPTFSLNHNQQSTPNGIEIFEDAYILKIQAIIDEYIEDENFGVKELCTALGMSRTQLHNKIKALTGKSTTRYIRSHRLQKARELLLNTDKNVSEVALDVGFKYHQHFSNYYIEEFGEPPSKTRN